MLNGPQLWFYRPFDLKQVGGLILLACLLAACFQTGPGPTGQAANSEDATPIFPVPVASATQPENYHQIRQDMVKFQIENRQVVDPLVLEAMSTVPRHAFVPLDYQELAYTDQPLPIGYGQTISQPYIVALMSESLGLKPGDRVLEIGTGSGYQAAILAEMGMEVYTIEIIPELAMRASDTLTRLGYAEIQILNADGYFGWEEHGPFDAIIVTAAPDHLPQPLVGQLREGGRLIIPIGPVGAVQTMWRFTRMADDLDAENLGPVRFVPFTRSAE